MARVIQALLASAAIPGVFPAVNIGGRFVVDGGVASHTPLSAAVALGATRLVVLPTGYACTLAAPPRSAVAMAMHALNILISRQVSDAVRRYRTEVDVVVVPPLCPLNASPIDFAGCGALIDRARRSTEAWLHNGVSMSDGVPHQLPPHSPIPRAGRTGRCGCSHMDRSFAVSPWLSCAATVVATTIAIVRMSRRARYWMAPCLSFASIRKRPSSNDDRTTCG